MRFNNHLLNYGNEVSLDQLPTAGLSPDYVYRETKRALEGVKGNCLILPGIDIGIPTKPTSRKRPIPLAMASGAWLKLKLGNEAQREPLRIS